MVLTTVLALGMTLGKASVSDIGDREKALFDQLIKPLLAKDSWNDALAYAAGGYLLIPVEAAYRHDVEPWKEAYRSHVDRLLQVDKSGLAKNPLSRCQYLYPISHYLVLEASQKGHTDQTKKLEQYLYRLMDAQWNDDDAIAYDHKPFRGVKDRIDHKLSLFSPLKSYYGAITDEELYVMAIGCQLKASSMIAGSTLKGNRTLDEMEEYAKRILATFGEDTRDGGWLFQTGAWRDHPDDAYAGNEEILRGMSPRQRTNVAWDTSHFHRFAAFIESYRNANPKGSTDWNFFESIRQKFAHQFVSKALIPPTDEFDGYRTTNFIDGWNGVYRFGLDKTLGPDKGYGPYQLSGTFLMGWWSLLGDPSITMAYQTMIGKFPFSATLLETYEGPMYDPTRKSKSWYQNGIAELLVRLAAQMGDS